MVYWSRGKLFLSVIFLVNVEEWQHPLMTSDLLPPLEGESLPLAPR